jgi:hypothetical protein
VPLARNRCSTLAVALLMLIGGSLASRGVGAQSVLKGVVLVNIVETPIAGAEVALPALNLKATSDSAGRFRIVGIPPGNYVVTVRALRFSPVSSVLAFGKADSVDTDMLLTAAKTVLPAVGVVAEAVPTGKLAAFDERRRGGFGHFVTSNELEKMGAQRLSDVMARVPGNKVMPGFTSAAWMYSGRGPQSRSSGALPSLDRMDIAKGAKSGFCYAAVMLDGIFVYQGAPGETLFDINSIPVSEIAGIESYAGGATMPTQYNGTRNSCGLIIIWTK